MIWYLFSTLTMGIGGIVCYIYFLKKGQFDDPEDTKYELFREDE
ncbi:MAG: cbb3-type cytochrome oxidase assembly protein CcoS [Chlamydiia bacterium]|nr:cbb3-type cytochrome oxidase assembly protein CcoS [Chlamydiia bacterium]